MTDRSTKVLLAIIAVALWGHLLTAWFTPTPVYAQFGADARMAQALEAISSGWCGNKKIC